MTELQSRALTNALRLLGSTGLPYAVLMPDGTKHGALEVRPVKAVPERARRSPQHNHVAKHDWITKVEQAKSGDELKFVCDTSDEAESLRGSITSKVFRLHGSERCISQTRAKDGKFEVSVLMVLD